VVVVANWLEVLVGRIGWTRVDLGKEHLAGEAAASFSGGTQLGRMPSLLGG